MVLDNADDQEIFFGRNSREAQDRQLPSKRLVDYLPHNQSGSILITTRDNVVDEKLAFRQKSIIVSPFEAEDAKTLLRVRLQSDNEYSEQQSMELIETLYYRPLAITQAAAYISERDVSLEHYLSLLSDINFEEILEQDFYDSARDLEIQNSIFLTWKISFDQISRLNPRAAEILSLMAVLDRQSIADFLLRNTEDTSVGFDKAIGALKAFL
jgi:hypothetical protein